MSDYNTLYYMLQNQIRNEKLWRQAYVAIHKAAIDITNESAETDNHANRLQWATEVISDCDTKVNQMKQSILDNSTIATKLNLSTDSDVQFVVNSLIDTFATGS